MRTLLIAAILGGAALPARADIVLMRNGDRISGEAVSMTGGKIRMRTSYAGEVALEWNEVASALLEPGRIARLAPSQSADTVYSGRATLSASSTSGNTSGRRLYGDAELTARALENRYQLGGKVERRTERGAAEASAWRLAGNYDRFYGPARFGYVRGALEHDRAKELERRASAGFGMGADIVRAARAAVSVRGGLDYVTEEHLADADRDYPALGWGVKASYAPWPALELFHEHDGLRNLRASGVVVHSKTGLRVPFTPALAGTAQVNIDWESRPAPGRKSTDAALLLGVQYAW